MKHMMKHKSLVIVGSGGHAAVVLDASNQMKTWENIIILDNQTDGVFLTVDDLYANRKKYLETHDIFVAIGDNFIRENFLNELAKEGFSLATVIHPSSIIADNVILDEGTIVLAGVILNPNVRVSKGVIVNTGARLDHHSKIGDFTHVCPGTVLAGDVTIGSRCFLGTGSIVSNQVNIADNVSLGAGCVVVKSITEPGTYVGVPARLLVK